MNKKQIKSLRNLRLFDRTVTIPNGSANEEMGYYQADSELITAVFENMWLVPQLTFNDTYRTNKGRYEVPVYGKFGSDVTALCDASAATGYDGTDYVPVQIDTKVSTVFGSCFISKGLVDKEHLNILKDQIAPSLAEAMKNDIQDMISTEGTPFTYTSTDLDNDPRGLVIDAITAYNTANEMDPTTFITNYEFYGRLMKTFASGSEFTPANNDKVLIAGVIGEFLGLTVIKSNIPEIFYMFNWRVLHIPIAKNTESDMISNPEYGMDVSTIASLQIIQKLEANSGVGETWFHLHYGKMIVSARQFLVATETILP